MEKEAKLLRERSRALRKVGGPIYRRVGRSMPRFLATGLSGSSLYKPLDWVVGRA